MIFTKRRRPLGWLKISFAVKENGISFSRQRDWPLLQADIGWVSSFADLEMNGIEPFQKQILGILIWGSWHELGWPLLQADVGHPHLKILGWTGLTPFTSGSWTSSLADLRMNRPWTSSFADLRMNEIDHLISRSWEEGPTNCIYRSSKEFLII